MPDSGSSNFSEEPEAVELDPSILDRTFTDTSIPLRRVLDRTRMWNQRFQDNAYEFNVHAREYAEAADSSLDEETQHQLKSVLADLTLSLGNERQSGLSQLAGLLNDVAPPAEPSHPGIHSNPLCCVALSCCSHSLFAYFPQQPTHISVS
jgi:hypothetical protein